MHSRRLVRPRYTPGVRVTEVAAPRRQHCVRCFSNTPQLRLYSDFRFAQSLFHVKKQPEVDGRLAEDSPCHGARMHVRMYARTHRRTNKSKTYCFRWPIWWVRFCSLAVLDPRVGYTMNILSPLISVLCRSEWLFHGQSCPRLDVVHPGRAWPSSPACIWHCSLIWWVIKA